MSLSIPPPETISGPRQPALLTSVFLIVLSQSVMLGAATNPWPGPESPPHTKPEETSATQDSSPTPSRRQQQRQLRLDKLQTPPPDTRSTVERALVWFERRGRQRLQSLNYQRFFPQVSGISTRSGLAVGVRYWNPGLKNTIFDLQGSALTSIRGYQLVDLQFGEIDQPEQRTSFFVDLRYRDFPREDFFGLGPDSRPAQRSDYRLEDASYDAVFSHQAVSWFRLDLRAGYRQVRIGPGSDDDLPDVQELFDDRSAPGLSEQPNFFRIQSSLLFDFRDTPGNPHRGGALTLSWWRVESLKDARFDFTRVGFDYRHYIPLGLDVRVLALRVLTSLDFTDEGSEVPFYMQESLGGFERLRGFRELRFRGENLLYLSAEYRWEAIPALEFALFYDAGKVFRDRTDFNLTGLKDNYGVGARIKTRSSVVFRVDLAQSSEGTRIYFKAGLVF